MSSKFISVMKNDTNYGLTENGGIKHNTTNSALLDMFGMGGSMRNRSEGDVILMFKKAYKENPTYALKCLFYLRDCREGAGERRFFRVCLKWLAQVDRQAVLRNLDNIPEFGRWDDLYALVGTSCEHEALYAFGKQLAADYKSDGVVSLAGKWAASENASSSTTKRYGRLTAHTMGLTSRQYRIVLSTLRERIRVLERDMSANNWGAIEFDKIPSRAGILYRNAFKKHQGERYARFMASKETKVNAAVLNPVDIAHQIFSTWSPDKVSRDTWEKYWHALPDYYNGKEEPGIAIVDVSGSMSGQPMEAAVSMGAYIAERGKGPFHNHFITFSDNPRLVEFEGVDIYDKFQRARRADWGGSTNIEAVFDLMLQTARKHLLAAEDMPKTLYIFSDMEFNSCVTSNTRRKPGYYYHHSMSENDINTVIEEQMIKWRRYGYTTPRVIFWNLDARHNNIPAIGDKFSYVSGFSMNMVETILSGLDGYALMMRKLDSPRYKVVY